MGIESVTEGQQIHRHPDGVHKYPVTKPEKECIQEMRNLIAESDDVLNCGLELDDEFLLAFIRGRKDNTENAFKTLQNYIHVRKVKYPGFFRNIHPKNFKYLWDGSAGPKISGILKHTDREGRVVGVIQYSRIDTEIHKVDDALQAYVTYGQELLRDPNAPKNGFVLVIDAAGCGLRHARDMSLGRIFMMLQIFLNAYPVQYKGFHIINTSFFFDTILTLMKQFVPKKLKERIHLHGSNYESLFKHVPREILPVNFGGLVAEDEAYNFDLEQEILQKADYYEKIATNW